MEALTQQLGINYTALQMGTKGRGIFSRDSLQSYTVKLFLSLFFSFFLSSVNLTFHIFVGFGRLCNYQTNDFFSSVIRRAFCRSHFNTKIVTKKLKFFYQLSVILFYIKRWVYVRICVSVELCTKGMEISTCMYQAEVCSSCDLQQLEIKPY